MGTSIPQLEFGVSRLETLVARGDRIDCLFLGSSVVSSGVDPLRFADAYAERTGRAIRCFNAGELALPAASAGVIGELFTKLARPRLVIYGTTSRDYIPNVATELRALIDQAPWVRYRLGAMSLRGWLVEHSYAYRQLLPYRLWFDPPAWDLMQRLERASPMTAEGFLPIEASGKDLDRPPAPDHPLSVAYRDYRPDPEALAGLDRLLRLRAAGIDVLVVEFPSHPSSIEYGDRGERAYRRFLDAVAGAAAQRQVAFWTAASLPGVPADGWVDQGHMNVRGARAFSAGLGRRVGEAVSRGELADPTR